MSDFRAPSPSDIPDLREQVGLLEQENKRLRGALEDEKRSWVVVRDFAASCEQHDLAKLKIAKLIEALEADK